MAQGVTLNTAACLKQCMFICSVTVIADRQHVLLGVGRVSACRDRAADQHVSHPGGAGDDRPAGTG